MENIKTIYSETYEYNTTIRVNKVEPSFDKDDLIYSIAIIDSFIMNKGNDSLLSRIRKAIRILFKKQIEYSETWLTIKDYDNLVDKLLKLKDEIV